MSTWKELIFDEMDVFNESFDDVISCTLSDEDLNVEFDSGYGGTEGKPFTVWTSRRVYFPVCYDGSEWVGSASRDPDGIATFHQGGG